MKLLALLIFSLAFLKFNYGQTSYSFPSTFRFGAATASYQIEGAWNVDGKLPSIWDTATHRTGLPQGNGIADGSTGDDVANSYYFYQKDIAALKEVGFQVYRFSVAWTRVLKKNQEVNQAGIDYYNRLIDGLLAEGIEPMLTIYHWDLPQWIQDLGGWTNPKTIDYYLTYAELLFKTYGDRVKMWITFNEPSIFCGHGYGWADHAPHIFSVKNMAFYQCGHHVLLAHAKAYHMYKEKYFPEQQGEVGINVNSGYNFKLYTNVTDEVIDRSMQFYIGQWTHALFLGDYPPVMREYIDRKSAAEGRKWSRLPVFTQDEINLIKGSLDFLALNYYTSGLVAPLSDFPGSNLDDSESEVYSTIDPNWERAESVWLYDVPEGLHDLLVWIKNKYNNPRLYITENGFSDPPTTLTNDVGRERYLRRHLAAISRAINVEGCDIHIYTVWSLVDNFEWMMGLTERFGIFSVDFNDPERPRTAKNSVQVFREVLQTGAVTTDWVYVNNNTVSTIGEMDGPLPKMPVLPPNRSAFDRYTKMNQFV